MENYKLSEEAKDDLLRIHEYGVLNFGEERADTYFLAFFDQFQQIAQNPYLYPPVDHIRKGYRRAISGVDSIYYRLNGNIVEIMALLGRQDINEII